MTTAAEYATSIAQISANLDRARASSQAKLAAVTGSPQARKAKEDAIRAELARYEASSNSVLAALRTQAATAAAMPTPTAVQAPILTPAPAPRPASVTNGRPVASASQLATMRPAAKAAFFAAGGTEVPEGAAPPIATPATPGIRMVQASAKLYDPAVRAAAYANPHPHAPGPAAYEFCTITMARFREKLLARTDMIAGLVKDETTLALSCAHPVNPGIRLALSYNTDALQQASDGLAVALPRLESLLSTSGLSEAVSVPGVPAPPAPGKPLTLAQVAAGMVGGAGGG